MQFFGQLKKAILELVGSAPAQGTAGRLWYRSDTNRPYLDDGSTVDQLMIEKHLGEARRSDKVELDDAGLGNEVTGVLPSSKGGTDQSSLVGESLQFLRCNAGETALEFAVPTALPSFNSNTVSANYTITDVDGYAVIFVDDTSVDRTITLPTAADNVDRRIVIKNISTDQGNVTVDGEGAETIEDLTTIDLDFEGAYIQIQSDGTGWFIVSENLTSIRKTYDLTVTASNWTTDRARVRPYRDLEGNWYARFNIVGIFSSGSSTSIAITTVGLVYKNIANYRQQVSVTDDNLQARTSDQQTHCEVVTPNSSVIALFFSSSMSFANRWGIFGDLELESKPTFVE